MGSSMGPPAMVVRPRPGRHVRPIRRARPIHGLRIWISEGLAQANLSFHGVEFLGSEELPRNLDSTILSFGVLSLLMDRAPSNLRSIRKLRIRKLRLVGLYFLGNPFRTWSFHPSKLGVCLGQTPLVAPTSQLAEGSALRCGRSKI